MQLGTQEQGKGMCPPAGQGAGPHPGSQSRPVLPLSEEIASVWLLEPVPSPGRAGCCRSAMGCVGFGTGSSPVSRPWHSSGMCLISLRSVEECPCLRKLSLLRKSLKLSLPNPVPSRWGREGRCLCVRC